MRPHFSCVVFLILLALGTFTWADDLRVMTFNIRYNNAGDGENAWPHRRALFFKTIETFNPDLLGLQEVKTDQGEQIKAHFKDYEMLGQPRDESPGAERSSI